MNKLAIYPFSQSSSPLYEFLPIFRPEYETVHLVSPVGLSLAGYDVGHATNRSNMGIIVQDDIDQALADCDALLVPFGDLKTDPAFYDAFAVMCKAAEQGKTVFCAPKLTQSQYKKLNSIASSLHYGFLEKAYRAEYVTTTMYSPSAPVVFVHNLTLEADSFEVTLSLAQSFKRDGHRVSVIGARPEYNFLGMNGASLLMNCVYGNQTYCSTPQYIQAFHHYLRIIELNQRPDVILVNIPGAAIPARDLYYNEAGIYLFLLSRIVRPDYAIVCMPYTALTADAFHSIDEELRAKFGCGLDMIHFTNRCIHGEQARHTGKEQTIYLPEKVILQKTQKLRKNNIPAYCALVQEERESLYQKLLSKLTDG